MPIISTVKLPVRSTPFDDFDRFFDRLSRHLSEIGWPEMEEGGLGGPAIDVTTYADEVLVAADLVGFAEEHVHVAVGDGRLLLRAERQTTPFQTAVVREVPLPEGIDAATARATFNNGVLTVAFPHEGDADDATVLDVE